MKKNVAGQKIGIQMNSATDGSAFTGTTTVYVTGDAGTQAIGSVGSGICTHEGNGYHTYAPAQAETNYDLVAFTFIGTGAIPSTVQIYTNFPQTVDLSTGITAGTITTVTNLTNLPTIPANWLTAAGTAADFTTEIQAGLATSAALAVVDGIVDDILLDTAEIGVAGAGLTNINLPNQTMDIVGNITGNLSGSVGSVTGAVGSVTGSVGSVTGLTAANLDVAVSTRLATAGYTAPDNTSITAIKAKTDNLPAAPAAVSDIPTAIQNADTLLNRDMSTGTDSGSPTVRTVRQALRFLRNKWSISGTTLTVTKEDDTTASWTASVTTDAAAEPITGSDPA